VVSFTPWPLYPREVASGAHWIGRWLSPSASMDVVVKRKNPFTAPAANQNLVMLPVA